MSDAPARTVRVMVVEDHDLMREATVRFLGTAADLEVVGAVASIEEAIEVLRSDQRPDVVVLDMKLPGVSGSEGIPMLRKVVPSVRVLVLTMLESADAKDVVRSAGGDGFLTKGCAPSELVEAVRTVAHGGTVGLGAPAVGDHRGTAALTPDEVGVLRLLLDSKSVGEIAVELGLGMRRVVQLVGSINDKTGASSKSAWLRYALDHDLL